MMHKNTLIVTIAITLIAVFNGVSSASILDFFLNPEKAEQEINSNADYERIEKEIDTELSAIPEIRDVFYITDIEYDEQDYESLELAFKNMIDNLSLQSNKLLSLLSKYPNNDKIKKRATAYENYIQSILITSQPFKYSKRCEKCNGTGKKWDLVPTKVWGYNKCTTCDGEGKIHKIIYASDLWNKLASIQD